MTQPVTLTTTKNNRGFGLNLALPTRKQIEPMLVLITLLSLTASMVAESVFEAQAELILVLNIISYLAGGWYATLAGWESLRHGEIDVDLLMVAAAVGAAIVGQWHEGAILLFLFSLSNVLQAYAMERSRNAIKSLLKLRPDNASVRRGGEIISVPIEDLKLGDVVVLRPGDRIPSDGQVTNGHSTVNQSTITGESMPVTKEIGDKVFAGTVNEHGTMDIAVTKLASESTLARIIKMVEDAQERHSNTQRRLDRFEQHYAKVVIFSVALMVVIPPLLFSVDFDKNFYRSMVLLVVASPCALVISTPASILSAIANGARKGVLYKGGTYLEQMASLKAIAFDKTGTITYGKPSVTDMLPAEGVAERDLLSTLACVESPSEHPIAQAIIEKARAENLLICEPDKFQAMPGRGIVAALNGRQVLVGTESLMQQHGLTVPEALLEKQRELEQGGKTTLLVYADQWLGLVGVADKVRPEAKETMRKLREAGIEHIAMLTGDNQRTAARIAEEVGVTEVHAELLPEQKVDVVNLLSEKYGLVAMVGDGVNDAPALATAGIGIAMGAAGTDVALETADVVLMADDLGKIPYAINLSKRARRVVAQNLTFAMGVIVVLVTLALIPAVKLPLPLGVVGHEGSTIVVVLNGLRLLVWRGK